MMIVKVLFVSIILASYTLAFEDLMGTIGGILGTGTGALDTLMDLTKHAGGYGGDLSKSPIPEGLGATLEIVLKGLKPLKKKDNLLEVLKGFNSELKMFNEENKCLEKVVEVSEPAIDLFTNFEAQMNGNSGIIETLNSLVKLDRIADMYLYDGEFSKHCMTGDFVTFKLAILKGLLYPEKVSEKVSSQSFDGVGIKFASLIFQIQMGTYKAAGVTLGTIVQDISYISVDNTNEELLRIDFAKCFGKAFESASQKALEINPGWLNMPIENQSSSITSNLKEYCLANLK